MASRGKALITPSRIEESILLLRGHKVLLDSTLAVLYAVQSKGIDAGRSTKPVTISFGFHVSAY